MVLFRFAKNPTSMTCLVSLFILLIQYVEAQNRGHVPAQSPFAQVLLGGGQQRGHSSNNYEAGKNSYNNNPYSYDAKPRPPPIHYGGSYHYDKNAPTMYPTGTDPNRYEHDQHGYSNSNGNDHHPQHSGYNYYHQTVYYVQQPIKPTPYPTANPTPDPTPGPTYKATPRPYSYGYVVCAT